MMVSKLSVSMAASQARSGPPSARAQSFGTRAAALVACAAVVCVAVGCPAAADAAAPDAALADERNLAVTLVGAAVSFDVDVDVSDDEVFASSVVVDVVDVSDAGAVTVRLARSDDQFTTPFATRAAGDAVRSPCDGAPLRLTLDPRPALVADPDDADPDARTVTVGLALSLVTPSGAGAFVDVVPVSAVSVVSAVAAVSENPGAP